MGRLNVSNFISRVEEIEYLKPAKQKDRFNFKPSLTESLIYACDYYLLSLCSRSLRGQKNEHCCMLIHTTIYSETHKDLWSLIKNQWLKPLKDNILKNDLPTINRLKNLWEKECNHQYRKVNEDGKKSKSDAFKLKHYI